MLNNFHLLFVIFTPYCINRWNSKVWMWKFYSLVIYIYIYIYIYMYIWCTCAHCTMFWCQCFHSVLFSICFGWSIPLLKLSGLNVVIPSQQQPYPHATRHVSLPVLITARSPFSYWGPSSRAATLQIRRPVTRCPESVPLRNPIWSGVAVWSSYGASDVSITAYSWNRSTAAAIRLSITTVIANLI